MNIWVPYANLTMNVKVLTDEHLSEVVYVGLDTLRAIVADQDGRLAEMWRSAPAGLLSYLVRADQERQARGQPAELRVRRAFSHLARRGLSLAPVMPRWFGGDPSLHLSHRSRLIRIDPEYYAQRLPFDTPLDLPLRWPKESLSARKH